jgi:hypothetical protein
MRGKIVLTTVAVGLLGSIAFMGGSASIARAGVFHSTDALAGSGDLLDSEVVLVQVKGKKGKGQIAGKKGKGQIAGKKGKGQIAGKKGKGQIAGKGRGGRGGSGHWRGGPDFWLGPLMGPWDE